MDSLLNVNNIFQSQLTLNSQNFFHDLLYTRLNNSFLNSL